MRLLSELPKENFGEFGQENCTTAEKWCQEKSIGVYKFPCFCHWEGKKNCAFCVTLHGGKKCRRRKEQAQFNCACRCYFLVPHPLQPEQLPEHPLHPEQPPRARDFSRERTARSTIPASTVSTMMSPMTVTSFENYI
jgi:hypothetical protein